MYCVAELRVYVSLPMIRAGVRAGNGLGADVAVSTTTGLKPLLVCSAMTVVEEPEPMVMVTPGARVWVPMMYCVAELRVYVSLPIVRTGVRAGKGLGADVAVSTTSGLKSLLVCSAMTVAEEPEPTVIAGPPGMSV